MGCKAYESDKELQARRTKELGSLQYQCRTCVGIKLCRGNMLKVARTHFAACRDYVRRYGS